MNEPRYDMTDVEAGLQYEELLRYRKALENIEALAKTRPFRRVLLAGDIAHEALNTPLCPDSPDGQHHLAPIGSDEEWVPSKDPCYYCGEKQPKDPGAAK